MHAALPASYFTPLGDFSLIQALEIFLPTCLLMLGNQSMYQKFFSAKSEKDARVAVVGWIIGTVILETVIVALAIVGNVLAKQNGSQPYPREILAFTALHSLPSLLGAVMMGAIFAKVISTANSFLFSPATNLINDIYVRYLSPDASDKKVLIVSRLTVVLLGGWALWQAVGITSVLAKTLYAYTIYSAALTPVILAAFFWQRATAAAAVASIAAGTVVTVWWDTAWVKHLLPQAIAERDAIFPALLVSLLCLLVVSYLTPPPDKEHLARLSA